MRSVLALGAGFVALLTSSSVSAGPNTAAGTPFGCSYFSRAADDLITAKRCGVISPDGDVHLDARRLHGMDYDRRGLASFAVGERGFYYVDRTGRTAPVALTDNWAEDFSNGLARSPRGKKIGFIDRSLRLAIPARYDGAYPFEHGRSVVCVGCKVSPPDREGYTIYEGGRWGCIDTKGREVVPVTQPSPPDNLNCAGD